MERKEECSHVRVRRRGFDLALMDDTDPQPMPKCFHFGYRLPAPSGVTDLFERMSASVGGILKPLLKDDSWSVPL